MAILAPIAVILSARVSTVTPGRRAPVTTSITVTFVIATDPLEEFAGAWLNAVWGYASHRPAAKAAAQTPTFLFN
jgi:hypothetical protein